MPMTVGRTVFGAHESEGWLCPFKELCEFTVTYTRDDITVVPIPDGVSGVLPHAARTNIGGNSPLRLVNVLNSILA